MWIRPRQSQTRVWRPADPVIAARVRRWLSIAAGGIRFGPATARAIRLLARSDMEAAQKLAERVLTFMEGHLAQYSSLAHEAATIADLACYSCVAAAPESGISLAPRCRGAARLLRPIQRCDRGAPAGRHAGDYFTFSRLAGDPPSNPAVQ